MSFAGEHAEICPVPLDLLAALYRADPAEAGKAVAGMESADRVRLALYCYGRAHFRELGLKIAATCDAAALSRFAGVMGQVLSAQSRGRIGEFGYDGAKASATKRKVSLAKSAA